MSFPADSSCVARLHPGVHFEPRKAGAKPDILVLHYTGLATLDRTLDVLSRPDSRVSCHYVIDEGGSVIQMVPEALRAWHAGLSSWHGETDINSWSIGIEIQYPGHDAGLPEFAEPQIDGLIALCRDIVDRHAIPPERVLAHSDIAPLRKIDPGERFPWRRLAEAGIAVWVEPEPIDDDPGIGPGVGSTSVLAAQRALAAFGYGAPATGMIDPITHLVLREFQRRHRPARIDGRLDRSSERTIARLPAVTPWPAIV